MLCADAGATWWDTLQSALVRVPTDSKDEVRSRDLWADLHLAGRNAKGEVNTVPLRTSVPRKAVSLVRSEPESSDRM